MDDRTKTPLATDQGQNQGQSGAIYSPNYNTDGKIIRALWYAWRLPELNRHQVALDSCDDILVKLAREAIEGGAETLADAAMTPGPVGDLLDLVYGFPPPKALTDLLKEKRQSLPVDFFQKTEREAVMVLPELDPGDGAWPASPPHTCAHAKESGAVITIRQSETTVSPLITPAWRDTEQRPGCKACQHKRTKREARKVLFELGRVGGLWGRWFESEAEYNKFAARTRQRRKRQNVDGAYTAYPTSDGRWFVIHDCQKEGGAPVTNDRAATFELLHYPANDTPENKRVSASGGWGGNWQGVRGDGRQKQAKREGKESGAFVQLWTPAGVPDVLAALGGTEKPNTKKYRLKIDAAEAFERLAAFELFERSTNRTGLEAFLEFIGVDVTHNAQGKPKESLCVMRDNGDPPAAPAPAPAPIYLPGVGVIL